MTERTQNQPRLVTCSYRDYRPEMGVPVATSVGRNAHFDHAPEVQALRPFGVFRTMDDRPLEEQVRAYRHRLHQRRAQIEDEFRALAAEYPDVPFVVLCWCSAEVARRDECHRRWAAAWFEDLYGHPVPEVRP